MLIPYRLNTLFARYPLSNWILIGLTCLISLAAMFSDFTWAHSWILDGWRPVGVLGHLFLHAGLFHLAGNLIFLWVFGNAICANTGNIIYLALYFGFGVAAASVHNIFDGDPAIGASGAINGIVGMATAMYPLNRVSVFWFFVVRGGTFETPLWTMSLLWLAFDLFGVLFGGGDVAVWAHVGGFAVGIATGMILLRTGIVRLNEYDNRSLHEILFG